MNYIYDGTFEGFLTAAGLAFGRPGEDHEFSLPEGHLHEELFSASFQVKTDDMAAAEFMGKMSDGISPRTVRTVLRAWLSEAGGAENAIFAYLKCCFEEGRDVSGWRANPSVMKVVDCARKTALEAHRFNGILRFRKLREGTYYAPFSPDCNVSLIVAEHFRGRLAGEKWIIHDLRRKCAVGHDGGRMLQIDCGDSRLDPDLSDESEERYQKLWRKFFDSISIGERKNPRLQRSLLPVRYWRYLVEKPQQGARNAGSG